MEFLIIRGGQSRYLLEYRTSFRYVLNGSGWSFYPPGSRISSSRAQKSSLVMDILAEYYPEPELSYHRGWETGTPERALAELGSPN